MYLAGDYINPTPHRGRCRVRIYRPDLPVEGSAAALRRFADDVAEQVERVDDCRRECVFESLWRRFAFAGFREIDAEEPVHDDGVELALKRVRESVATFDF